MAVDRWYLKSELEAEAKGLARELNGKLIEWNIEVTNHGAQLRATVDVKEGKECDYPHRHYPTMVL